MRTCYAEVSTCNYITTSPPTNLPFPHANLFNNLSQIQVNNYFVSSLRSERGPMSSWLHSISSLKVCCLKVIGHFSTSPWSTREKGRLRQQGPVASDLNVSNRKPAPRFFFSKRYGFNRTLLKEIIRMKSLQFSKDVIFEIRGWTCHTRQSPKSMT